jgi:catechol 2,3-dioxygenase-like lactoylglutathione lyase family enzyme
MEAAMNEENAMEAMMGKYLAQARRSKREDRMIFNHICIRVEDLDAAEQLLCDSFGLEGFLSPGGETFDEEKEFRVAWLDEHNMYLELSQFEKPSAIGYDTGVGQPIGHLSEIGFFVPDMDRALAHLEPLGWEISSKIDTEGARMYKIDTQPPGGIPVELIDIRTDDSQ